METLKKIENTQTAGQFVLDGQPLADKEGFKNVSKIWYSKTMSYDEGLEQLTKDRAESEDISVAFDGVAPGVDSNGRFVFTMSDGRQYKPTAHCMNQLGTNLGIGGLLPNKLLDGDRGDAETLQILMTNAIRKLPKSVKNKKFLWRTRKDGSLRAFLSELYQKIDNRWLIESLKVLIPSGRLSHWRTDADAIYGNVLIPDSIRAESDSEYGGMLSVGNSEIGTRRLSSLPSLFRAICMNGCIWGSEKGVAYEHIHKGKELKYDLLFQELKMNLESQIPLLDRAFLEMQTLHKLNWSDVSMNPLFAQCAIDLKIPKKETVHITEAFKVEPEKTAFGFVQAITRASQRMNRDLQIEMESYAGSLMFNNGNMWDKLKTKAKVLASKDIEKHLMSV